MIIPTLIGLAFGAATYGVYRVTSGAVLEGYSEQLQLEAAEARRSDPAAIGITAPNPWSAAPAVDDFYTRTAAAHGLDPDDYLAAQEQALATGRLPTPESPAPWGGGGGGAGGGIAGVAGGGPGGGAVVEQVVEPFGDISAPEIAQTPAHQTGGGGGAKVVELFARPELATLLQRHLPPFSEAEIASRSGTAYGFLCMAIATGASLNMLTTAWGLTKNTAPWKVLRDAVHELNQHGAA